MWLIKMIFAALFIVPMTLAHAAGLKLLEIPADPVGPTLQAAMWSPCAAPAGTIKVGLFYVLSGVRDCPIAGGKLPLIVISHGFGGTYLGHHDTAETLADAGFIVVALNHPDDTATNKTEARYFTALINRPTDVKRLIDFMLSSPRDAAKIDPHRIGFFGFSRGGYTGLVLGGANPDFRELRSYCENPTDEATCPYINTKYLATLKLIHDPRIKAIVAADPLSSVFPTKNSLEDVTVPLQLWGSQRGGDGVLPDSVATVARNLPVRPEFHVVPDSAHFAFLAPCGAKFANSFPDLCIDSPGFDRVAFHKDFN